MRRATQKFGQRTGFTLLETIVVLAIVGLLAGSASQLLLPPSDRLRLENAARDFCASLRATRTRAIAKNAEVTLVVDIFNKTYVSPAAGARKLPADVGISLDIANTQHLSPVIGAITFFPDGTSTGGKIILQSSGARATISINWLTGGAKCVIG